MMTCLTSPPPILLAAGSNTQPMPVTGLLYLAAVILAVSLMVIVTRHRIIRGQRSTSPPARELYEQLKKESSAKHDLEALMIELDELARQLMGRLDSRFAKLEATIRDADERIDRLNRMIRARQGNPAMDVTIDELGADGFAATGGPLSDPTPHAVEPHAEIHRLADQGLTPVEIAEKSGRSTGEVELILSLRRVKHQVSAVSAQRSIP